MNHIVAGKTMVSRWLPRFLERERERARGSRISASRRHRDGRPPTSLILIGTTQILWEDNTQEMFDFWIHALSGLCAFKHGTTFQGEPLQGKKVNQQSIKRSQFISYMFSNVSAHISIYFSERFNQKWEKFPNSYTIHIPPGCSISEWRTCYLYLVARHANTAIADKRLTCTHCLSINIYPSRGKMQKKKPIRRITVQYHYLK